MTSDKKNPSISAVEQSEVALWVEENKAIIPAPVLFALTSYLSLTFTLSESQGKLRSFLLQLRRSLGITPSSEKKTLLFGSKAEEKKIKK